jgi:branched-chain amino acid transport system permease protein
MGAARGRAALKDAALAAFVALVLAFPLVGFETVDLGDQGSGVRTRFGWVAIGVGAVFAARLVLALLPRLPPVFARLGPGAAPSWLAGNGARVAAALLVVFAALLPFLPFSSRYVVDLATTVLIYIMLGWGLNVVVGLAGLLDLGYVAFYAVGAYSFALIARWLGLDFWAALPVSGVLAATFGVVLGFPVLRLRGDYLAIVTLGFGEMVRIVLLNWTDVTGGPNGIAGVPRPSLLGFPSGPQQRIVFLYYVILALALATNLFTLRLRRLPVGRAWEALREDEIACRALGIDPTKVKLSAFAIGAMLGGFAGAFFATRQGFISPESFTFQESATILAIVVLGGMGSQLGVVLAAVALVTLPEFGRVFAEFRMLLFGAAMVGIMVWRPRGFLSRRAPSIRLGSAEAR